MAGSVSLTERCERVEWRFSQPVFATRFQYPNKFRIRWEGARTCPIPQASSSGARPRAPCSPRARSMKPSMPSRQGLARIRFAIDEPSYWPGGAYSSCASTSIRTARSSPGRSAARTARPRGTSLRIRGGGVPLPGRWCRSGGERYPRSAKMAERARESAWPARGGGPAPCPACRWEGCGYGFHRRRRLAGAE